MIGSDGLLVVWSMESGDTVFTERRKISDCWTIGEWSPEGDQLAIGTNDGEIHVIPFTPLPPHPQRVVLRGHDDGIIALTWHPTGNRLATAASGSSEIRIWDWSLEQLVLSLSEMEGEPTKMAWDPEGRRLAASSKAGEIVVWDATAGLLLSSSRSESEEK